MIIRMLLMALGSRMAGIAHTPIFPFKGLRGIRFFECQSLSIA